MFSAERDPVHLICERHLRRDFKQLPNDSSTQDMVRWLVVCQWNVRAEIYLFFIERIREQCEAETGSPCSRTTAREHLAKLIGVSGRTVERWLHPKKYPEVRDAKTKK